MKKFRKLLQAVSLTAVLALTGCMSISPQMPAEMQTVAKAKHAKPVSTPSSQPDISLSEIPAYNGEPYTVIHNNTPYFTAADLTTKSYESYSRLDSLGRCGPAVASIGKDLMPDKKRESIGMIRPTGWHTVKYDGIEGRYLYNRCHLIGYQLTGENANKKNLITGTRYMNTDGMEPFENMTADYIKETGNHVLYRITPLFKGDDLVAEGVLMEAQSVEDKGKGIEFCVFCYNVQPGITIDYSDGNSARNSSSTAAPAKTQSPVTTSAPSSTQAYIGNRNSKIFHYSWCSSVDKMKDANKVEFSTRQDAVNAGYKPCKRCNP